MLQVIYKKSLFKLTHIWFPSAKIRGGRPIILSWVKNC